MDRESDAHESSGPPFHRRGALALFAAGLLGACTRTGKDGSSTPDGPVLPPWRGTLHDLFDDSIHPAAVGLSLDGRSPALDPLLRTRAAEAEVVARLLVTSLTVNRAGAKALYTLSVRAGLPALMPPRIEERAFELQVGPESPGFAIVRTVENELNSGKFIFIGFLHRFAGPEGTAVHFHLTADTPEVAAVIQEAAALEEVQGRGDPP
ncbi:MAG: cobalamin ABC transporter substrate-binding protein [Polyangiaceae bacterium]|nr:cobalamin ABC transporter substrate-binding protein [Polyangiaceae bacterium]